MSTNPIDPMEPRSAPRSVVTKYDDSEPAPTRSRSAWRALTFGLAALIIGLIFVLQNLQSVEVTFLSLHGHLPLAIMLLLVAVLSALIVFTFGAARIAQLRTAARRSRRET